MPYDFNRVIERRFGSGTHSFKWEGYEDCFPGFQIDTSQALSMWVADMDFETLPEVKEALAQRIEHGIYGYPSESNNDAFRSAAIAWFERRWGWSGCQRDWMLFCPGVVPALYASVQAFTEPGDGVIVQTPVYYPFMGAIQDSGRTLVNNRLLEEKLVYTMDYEELETLAQDPANKLAIFCSPHNPVGRVWSREELQQAFDICARHDVLILCDEIHADLIMPGYRFTTAGLFDQYHDRLILAHAASKTFNLAGLTSALITVPNAELRMRLANQFMLNCLSRGNTFGPLAGAAAYRTGDAYVDELTTYIAGNMDHACAWLAEHLPQVQVAPLQGTYLVWMDFRGLGLEEEELYHRVIEEAGIVGDLGRWFGPGGEGFMRFNFATPRANIDEFLIRLQVLQRV